MAQTTGRYITRRQLRDVLRRALTVYDERRRQETLGPYDVENLKSILRTFLETEVNRVIKRIAPQQLGSPVVMVQRAGPQSKPPANSFRITNIYVGDDKLHVEYDVS